MSLPRPKVLLGAAAVPQVAGGIELWCARAAVQLRRRGFDTAIVTAEYDPGPAERAASILKENYARFGLTETLQDVPIVGLGLAGRPAPWASVEDVARFFGNQVTATGAHVVFPNELWLAWACCAGASTGPGHVQVAAMAHTDSDEVYKLFERHRWLLSDVVGVSSTIVQHLQERCDARVRRIPYGVPSAQADPLEPRARQPLRAGFIGRIRDAHKGVLLLPDVIAAAKPRGVEVDCWIAGEGPDEAELRERFSRAGVASSVRWFGAIPAEEVPAFAASLDILLMPSRFEGISIALLEAMTQGVVPVVSPVSGMADAIEHGRTGWIVADRNAADFAEALVALAHDRDRLSAMGAAARQAAVASYSEDLHWDRIAEYIQDLCSAPAPRWPKNRYPTGDLVGRTHRLLPEPLGTYVRRIGRG